jgi:surfactin synthase thioesterase subunit/malonyl CoA-acyl carrier protein transacylase
MGEVAAAHAAGVLSLEDAAKIICRRGHLLKKIQGQARMVLVEMPEPEFFSMMEDTDHHGVNVASHNAPDTYLLVGDPESVQRTFAYCEARDFFARIINVAHGSHGPQVEQIKDEMLAAIADIQPREESIPLYSTVTGERIQGKSMTPDYWYRNLRQEVKIYPAMDLMIKDGCSIFAEISPNPVLLPSLDKILQGRRGYGVPLMRKDRSERGVLLEAFGRLHTLGHSPDWSRFFWGGYRLVRLPGYPWERKSYWTESGRDSVQNVSSGPSLGKPLRVVGPNLDVWKLKREREEFARIAGRHGGAMFLIDKIHEAMSETLAGDSYFTLNGLDFSLPLPEITDDVALQIVLADRRVRNEEFHDFRVHMHVADWPEFREWPLILHGRIRRRLKQFNQYLRPYELPGAIRERSDMILESGGDNEFIKNLWRGQGEILAELSRPHDSIETLGEGLQLLVEAAYPGESREFLPDRVSRVRKQREKRFALWCHALVRDSETDDHDGVEGDLRFFDRDDRIVLEISGLLLRTHDYLAARAGAQEKKSRSRGPDPEEIRITLRSQAARILGVSAERIEIDRAIAEFGLSSMGLFELRNWVRSNYGVTIPLRSFIEQEMSIRTLCEQIIAGVPGDSANVAADDGALVAGMMSKLTPPGTSALPKAMPVDLTATPVGGGPVVHKSDASAEGISPEPDVKTDAGQPRDVAPAKPALPTHWVETVGGGTGDVGHRVFCVPGEGRDEERLRDAIRRLDDRLIRGLEVCIVRYPYRIRNERRDFGSEVESLLKEMTRELQKGKLELPFSFYGHGLGGILAYELAYRLEAQSAASGKRGKLAIQGLFFSGMLPPHVPDAERPLHHREDSVLFEYGRTRYGDEWTRDNLDVLRGHLRLRETYIFSWRPRATSAQRQTVLTQELSVRKPHFTCPIAFVPVPETPGSEQRQLWAAHTQEEVRQLEPTVDRLEMVVRVASEIAGSVAAEAGGPA